MTLPTLNRRARDAKPAFVLGYLAMLLAFMLGTCSAAAEARVGAQRATAAGASSLLSLASYRDDAVAEYLPATLYDRVPAIDAPPTVYTYDAGAQVSVSEHAAVPARSAERLAVAPGGHKQLVVRAPSKRDFVAAETATTSVGDVLMPGGSAIGKAGTDATIREISGGYSDAQTMFDQLSQGGRVVANTSKLTRVELPNGGLVQLRTVMSRSPNTAATIDVNIPGIDITKLKYNP
jgi:hypothetical protein